ncbi:MAG TPA: serine/threonine-protein kinase [Pyrinomonadaceae bacterium]|jgi:serine/threonine-protein kinase
MKFCSVCNKSYDEGHTFCPVDGEVLQESPESFVGRVIDGKYRVEGFIAQGGMGAVYRARHILLGDEVVIKTLRSEMRNNAEWLKRFQREGKAARAFRHPNSVTVYDLSAGSDGMLYMVMEYVEGHTLDKELRGRGRFTPSEALEVLEPVADVLDAAHARGVVHRDLKPENIMLGPDGRGGAVVKVLDLGIAKLTGAGDVNSTRVTTSLTMAGQILGTPYYMSPEQWGETPRDGVPEIDGRTDVYSLGVIFFELVAGRKPLGGRTLSELRQKHVAEPLPSLSEAAPGTPEEFGRAVARAMAKDRADRPPTAGAFVEELRAALGLAPRERARGPRTPAADSVVTLDAARRAGGNEAVTARLTPDTAAGLGDVSRADTILTNEFDAPAAGRETDAQRRRDTSGVGGAARRREGVRETSAPGAPAASDSSEAAADARRGDASDFARGRDVTQDAGVSVTAPETRRTLAPLVAGGALALLLLAGVGGWLAWRGFGRAEPAPAPAQETPRPAGQPSVPKVEAAGYWFEAFDRKEDTSGARIADAAATLRSGKWFKFHFVPRQRGYLYIVGPGAGGNAQTTLLTAQGAVGLKSNLVGAVADFSFPFGATKFRLDDNPGADDFTFIFSPTPLTSPAFLAGKYLHELTPAEVRELEDLRARHRADAPEISVRGEGADRRVIVLAPEPAAAAGRPLIFDVRVDHR